MLLIRMLLLLLSSISLLVSPQDPCPAAVPVKPTICPSLPSAVPANQYPAGWIKEVDLVITKHGNVDILICRDGFVGQLGPGSKSFTNGESYHCDRTTGKWIQPGGLNYTAHAFVSCGTVPKGTHNTFCSIVHQQSDGAMGIIRIHPGNEQICPIGQTLQFINGRAIQDIECSGRGPLKIVDGNGTVILPSAPKLMCVPGCVRKKQGGSSTEFGGAGGKAGSESIAQNTSVSKAVEQPLPIITSDSCPDAVPVKHTICPSLPFAVPANQYPAQWIKGADLVIKKYGELDIINCPDDGYVGQMGPGSKSFSFGEEYRCDDTATGKWIHPEDNYTAPAFVSCGKVPKGTHNTYCGIAHQQSDGAQGLIAIYPGNEQICPIGETLQFADGRAIQDIKCSGAGLKIVDGDGSVTRPPNPKLICVPGCVRKKSL